jgi:hypothetical protein
MPTLLEDGIRATDAPDAVGQPVYLLVEDSLGNSPARYDAGGLFEEIAHDVATVDAATTAALPTNTYLNGVITASVNGALPAQDGVTLSVNDALLVKNEGGADPSGADLRNGPYIVTSVGSGGSKFVLTRRADSDSDEELLRARVFVTGGSTQSDMAFVQDGQPVVLGASAINFIRTPYGSRDPRLDIATDDAIQKIAVEDDAVPHGLGWDLTFFLDPADLEDELFSTDQHEAAEAIGAAEAARLNAQDVSGYPKFSNGANLRMGLGQSLMAASALARLFLSQARMDRFSSQGWIDFDERPAWMVGPDTRCVEPGPVYTPFADAKVTASIAGTVMTVTAVERGVLAPGQALSSTNADFTASITTNVMTVTAVSRGTLAVGQKVTGAGVTLGTTISSLGTGVGDVGTYNLTATPNVGSEAMSSYFVAAATIVSFGTGTGGVGTYNISVSQTVTSRTIYASALKLFQIVENYIAQTGVDTIRTEDEIATGNYNANDRGGTPETTRENVNWALRNDYYGNVLDAVDAAAYTVSMNHAKTDASLADIGTGDGLARLNSMVDVFYNAIIAKGSSEWMHCDAIDVIHGQADEAAATPSADYKTGWETFGDNIESKLSSKLGQVDMPPYLMSQVGGPKYGTIDMLTANAQVDMMLDVTGTSARFHLVGVQYEVPSFYFQVAADIPGFPTLFDQNGHPTLAGNVLMGMRSAIALHFIQDREENYWLPFPFRCFYEGKNFLLVVPNKFPPLREVWMVCGAEVHLLDSLGITFENADGGVAPVEFSRVVKGHFYLIEGRCTQNIADFPILKTGRRNGPSTISGFTNIRDSFGVHLSADTPLLKLPFDENQTIYAKGPTSVPYLDSPLINGLGRYLEDIPGWVGPPDLGNPCARRTITAEVFS